MKADGYFTTGQSSFDDNGNPIEAYLNTDTDGNAETGLPSSLPGKFSVGDWVFTFNAYTSDDMTTDDDGDGVPDSLYYQGTGTSVTLSSGGENIVSVTVESVGEGTLVVKGATVGFSTDDYAYYVLLGDVDTPDFSGETSYSQSEIDEGVTISDALSPGYYTVNLYIQGGSYVWKNTLENVPIRANLTTVVSGEFEEEDDSLVTAYISSVGLVTLYSGSLGTLTVTEPIDDDTASAAYSLDGYTVTESDGTITAVAEDDESTAYTIVLDSDVLTYSVSAEVSDADALAAALAVDGATVTLTSSITLSSSLSVTSDTTIDLNGNELTLDSSTYLTASGNASLTLEGGDSGKLSASTSGAIRLKDGASLTIDGGTYTSTKNYLIYANADSADSTAAISVSNASLSSDGYYTICAVNGNTDITIDNSTVTAGSYAAVCNQSGETMTLTLKDSTITSTSTTGYGMYNASGNMSITLDNTTVTSTKQAIYSVSGETALSISDGSSVTSTSSSAVSSTGSKLTVEMSGGTVSGGTYGINSGAATTAISVSGGTISGTDYGISISNGCTSGTVEITGGSISGGDYSLVVGGDIEPNEDGVSISISGSPVFTGQVYLGGYATTTIAGGTFYDESMPALHMRSGNLSISGGTFGTGLTGTSYDYAYTNSGSVEQPATVVIEAAGGGFGDLGTVSITGGTFNNLGLGYFVNPAYDGSAPSVSVDSTVSYTSYSNFKYRRSLTKTSASSASGYAYFLDTNSNYSSFSGTVTLDGTEYTVGDLETATETDGAYSF